MDYDEEFRPEPEEKKSLGKGFYIVLAVCLLAICGVTLATFTQRLDSGEESPETTASKTHATTTAMNVVVPATSVTDDRTTATTTVTTTTTAKKTTTIAAKDEFVFPVSNTVLKAYSEDPVYFETLEEWQAHTGVDFAADKGKSVKAIADGTVSEIRTDVIYGDTVVLEHAGKIVSAYYGTKAQGIKAGQKVKAGDVIGVVTEIPAESNDPSHIHVEVRYNGKCIDPLTLIRGTTVKR